MTELLIIVLFLLNVLRCRDLIIPWEDPIYTPPPTPHPPTMLGCTFLRLIKHIFLPSWRLFFQKVTMIWNFWKFAINFCDSVNPLWVSGFSFFTQQTQWVVESPRRCIVSDCAVSLTGYVASTATAETKQNKQTKTAGTGTGVQDGPALPAIFLWCKMSATSAWSSMLCTCSIGGTQRAKETRHV